MTFETRWRWLVVTMLAVVAAMSLSVAAQQGSQGLQAQFERARLLEENSKTLNEAIALYKQVAARAGSNRALAAQALLRAAESYQKLGDVQARGLYEQLVRDYTDQKDVVMVARTRLSSPPVAHAKGDRAVWTGRNVDLTGRVSADGRFISFYDWGYFRLMIHDVATNVERALMPVSTGAESSAISRDSKQIVYGLGENGRAVVRIAALPTSGFLERPRQFVVANAASFSSFDWSPDDRWIATAFSRTDGTGQIGLITAADGSFRSLKSLGRNVVGTLANPAPIFFSPDGRYLAYDRPSTDTGQQRDVFVLAVDGSRDIPAVVHSANDAVMGWSPDGTRLLFRSDRTGSWALWAQSFVDGTAQGTPELLRSDIGRSVSLGVTASGALYLYKRASTRDITLAPIDLEAGKLLGPPVGFPQGFIDGASDPSWSPDGKSLAYLVTCVNDCLVIRSVATGQVRRLAPTLSNVAGHRWSPDGRSILAVGRDGMGRAGVFRIDVQSGEATPVTSELGGRLAGWSPEGTKVYFSRGDDVVERDVASGSERVVHREAGSGGLRLPQLSPDGQFVAGYLPEAGDPDPSITRRLLVVPAAGGQPRELLTFTQRGGGWGPIQWTSDSRAVIAMLNPFADGDRRLWLVPVAGGGPRKLDIDTRIWMEESIGGRDRGFSVSPDQRNIAFQMGKNAAEVWALENFLPAAGTKR